MKITIAGANSFIGKRMIVLAKTQPDIELTLVVRRGRKIDLLGYAKDVRVVECDMEEYSNLGTIAGQGDCFIDLSWVGSRGMERQNSVIQKYNYECNMAAMRSMAEIGYKTLVSAGSQAEYGQISGFISEETSLNANIEYGKYKVQIFYETTELCKQYGIRFIEPRYFSLYGPGDYQKTLIMSCIDKMIKNKPVELNECKQLWDYLYVDDAVEGVLSLCRKDSAWGAYNFATGNYRMLREFVMDIHKAVGSKSHVQFGAPNSTFKGLIINLHPIVDRLRQEVNWFPKVSFIDGIIRTTNTFNKM